MEVRFCIALIDYFEFSEETDNFSNEFLNESKNSVLKLAQSFNLPLFIFSASSFLKPFYENTHSFSNKNDLFLKISNLTKEYTDVLLFHSNAPFTDKTLTHNLMEQHQKYRADYTFYEYFPFGLFPTIINHVPLKKIAFFATESPIEPYNPFTLDTTLKKDLNQYDTEILIALNDFRFIKEDFFITNTRTAHLLKALKPKWLGALNLQEFLEKEGGFLRGIPPFIEVSLTNKQNGKSLFSYSVDDKESHFPLENLEAMLNELNQNQYFSTIQFTLNGGEPLFYNNFNELLCVIKKNPHFNFILETDGTLLEPYIESIKEIINLTTIIYISAASKEMYIKIHGIDAFSLVEKNADFLLNNNFERTYLEFIRMNENEEEIKPFLERWKAFDTHVLIGQYNNFCGKIENRKVVDLAPLKRFACFKLAHELFIDSESNILLCGQDKTAPHIFCEKYNKNKSIVELSKKLQPFYQSHLLEKDIPELCKNCDVWYLFNL